MVFFVDSRVLFASTATWALIDPDWLFTIFSNVIWPCMQAKIKDCKVELRLSK